MAFAGLSTVLVYKKEKCLVKSGKDTSNSNLKRIDKKEIASGALNKWKTAARKGSGIN